MAIILMLLLRFTILSMDSIGMPFAKVFAKMSQNALKTQQTLLANRISLLADMISRLIMKESFKLLGGLLAPKDAI